MYLDKENKEWIKNKIDFRVCNNLDRCCVSCNYFDNSNTIIRCGLFEFKIDNFYTCNIFKDKYSRYTVAEGEIYYKKKCIANERMRLFKEVKQRFKREGFERTSPIKKYSISMKKGDMVVRIFVSKNELVRLPDYWGLIAIDRDFLFDKLSKCPIFIRFPENEKEWQFLLEKIEWLKTKEGCKASNEYEFEKWIKQYPNFN